ncbi:MAG TPA: beta-L-arabinofuranosidase domain-containing protein [Gaiellaceae bacterium]|nr:beta-L-arabinofuranosidase domain-containing protein [Gaiellaceae bacterium]
MRPAGWLADQLRVQAAGLSGHLDEFWPDVAESGWIGGDAEGWERGPYWLDGVVPLAFLLDDESLQAKVTRWVDHILEHQQEDGWLGPVRPLRRGAGELTTAPDDYDPWPAFVVLKALTQYAEATGDERIRPAIVRFLRRLDALLDERPQRRPSFSQLAWLALKSQIGWARWAELVLSIHWLHRRTGEPWLLDLAAKVGEQGIDWRGHFDDFRFRSRVRFEEATHVTHVVNLAMALKASALVHAQSGDPEDRASVYRMIELLDRHHGQLTGLFSGDEHLAGRSPSQGTELCAVVEYMFSLETLISLLGDPGFGDRLERLAYNALPAPFTPDMWAHQYLQQANQVECVVGRHVWATNSDESNIFGLEPQYGCCTANLHQGWPKFVAHLFMATRDGGLLAACYGPCRVETTLPDGTRVVVDEETSYPFDGEVRLTIAELAAPASFPLVLRIPAWAEGARVLVGGEELEGEPGSFLTLERQWEQGDAVELRLPLEIRAERRFGDSVALHRGPLVFALAIEEEFREIAAHGPAKDYEVRPASPWNYGLEIDPARPGEAIETVTAPIPETPFDPRRPPVVLRVPARRVPSWSLEDGCRDAAPPPSTPASAGSEREVVALIPYGSAHLRVSEFPLLRAEPAG